MVKHKTLSMKLQLRLLTIFLCCSIATHSYSQTTTTEQLGSVEERIQKVENSLRPLVTKEDASLWNLEAQMQKHKVAGLSIAVIHNNTIDWAKGYGITGNSEQQNVNNQTVFQAASMSKFVNAIAVLRLAAENNINLDEDINQYLTSWQFPYKSNSDSNPITIRQLLSHTAGLSTHGFAGYKNANKLPSIIQTLEGKKPANSDKVEQILPNNQQFKYSGGGTQISQLIVMDQSKMSYESFINKHVFTPLEMANSFYSIELEKYSQNIAFGHQKNGKSLKHNYNSYPESAAAGLWTTPSDLAKLIIDLQKSLQNNTGTIISQQSSKELIQSPLENSNAALGLFTEKHNEELYVQHSGSNKGFRGKFIFSPQNGTGVVIMVNAPNTKIIEEIIRSVAAVYQWKGFETLITNPDVHLTNSDLKKYTGTYQLKNRKVIVSLKKGQLQLTEKGKWSSKLTALNNNTFVVDIVKPQATIEFITNEEGTIRKCILKQGAATEWVKLN